MTDEQSNDPLHGVTLRALLEDLVARRGWDDLAHRIRVRCFAHEPSVQSSLKFLRKTEWARKAVEALYLQDQRMLARKRERNRERAQRRQNRVDPTTAESEQVAPPRSEED